MTLNPFYIHYEVSKSPIAVERIGGGAILVAEARNMNPPVDKYNRSDARYEGGFESTLLEQWEEISITVINILHGHRDEISDLNLSKHLDFKEFFQSMAGGRVALLVATNIGGIDDVKNVKLINPSSELIRKGQRQKFSTTFNLRVVD